MKLDKRNADVALGRYREMTLKARGRRIIVLPEAALPGYVADLEPYIADLYRSVVGAGSSLVFGLLRDTNGDEPYYNSIIALDGKVTIYDKAHLVPYAEFFPVPDFIRSWLRMMSLPSYDITHGAPNQPPLYAGGLKLGATVCYEDAYGSSML